MKKAFAVLLTVVAVDAAGIAMIFPNLPNLLRDITGIREITGLFGQVLALYALMQFVSAPLLGVLSDRYGRRPVLLLSLAGSAIDYLIMAFAPTLWLLLVGRAMAGMTAASTAVSAAYVADITPDADRARRFGLLQALFGAGFVAGSLIGGSIGDHVWRRRFLVAATLNVLNLAVAFFLLPESRKPEGRKQIDWRTMNPLLPLRWAAALRPLLPLLVAFVLLILVSQTYTTVWVLFAEDRFGWSSAKVGLSLSVFGVLVALAQAFAVGPSVRRLGEHGALLLGIGCESVALLGLAFVRAEWAVFALIPLVSFGSIGLSALRALQTRVVDAGHQGELQGVVASLVGLAAIVGPLLFSEVYARSVPEWNGTVWLVGLAIYALTVPVVLVTARSTGSR